MKNEKPDWHLSEEQLTTLSGPNLKFNSYPSVFLNNDVTEEAVKIAIRLKLFGDHGDDNSRLTGNGVERFLARLNYQLNRNSTGASYFVIWDGTHKAEETKKKCPEEFMVACVKALEILKWIWDDTPQVRLKTKVVEMVHSWGVEEHCEVFGGEDADNIWDQEDDLRATINRAYKHHFKN